MFLLRWRQSREAGCTPVQDNGAVPIDLSLNDEARSAKHVIKD